MSTRESAIHQLQALVDTDPWDPFLRCNLACVLGSAGDYQRAMQHLGVAMEHTNGAVAAGCVSSAIREITDEFSRLWQLPESVSRLARRQVARRGAECRKAGRCLPVSLGRLLRLGVRRHPEVY